VKETTTRLIELARLFGKLGVIGFGGPAAHIAMMRREVVVRRGWLTEEHFLDLVGATNLIPGPSSTEMAIHIGRERAGWSGLLVAGSAFITPAMLIVLACAWIYVRFEEAPAVTGLLYGIDPVVVAIIVHALWKLGKLAVTSVWLGLLAVVVLVLYLAGVNELLLLAGPVLLVVLVTNRGRFRRGPTLLSALPLFPLATSTRLPDDDLARLFLLFLKFGAIVFGSGYVLIAFVQADLVTRLGWLTDQQLVDAVAIGQFTPGPVFTTATFIGYLVRGVPGALLATIAIFLPGFLLVAGLNPLVARMRRSPWASAALDGANLGAVGLMGGVTVDIGRVALVDAPTVVLFAAAIVVVFRWDPNPVWLIGVGALVGAVRSALP
jgi:chromate transporter